MLCKGGRNFFWWEAGVFLVKELVCGHVCVHGGAQGGRGVALAGEWVGDEGETVRNRVVEASAVARGIDEV